MAQNRVLVVPPYRPRGMLGMALFVGAVVGVLAGLIITGPPEPESGLILLLALIVLMLPFALGFALGVTLAFLLRRRRDVVVLGAAAGLGMGVGAELTGTIASAYTDEYIGDSPSFILVVVAILTSVCAAIAIITHWVIGRIWFSAAEQDGNLCWRCGTRFNTKQFVSCNQCGAPVDPDRFRLAPVRGFVSIGRRIGWIGFLAIVIAGGVWVSSVWSTRIKPARERVAKETAELMILGKPWPCGFWEPGSNALSPVTPRPGAQVELGSSMYLHLVVATEARTDGVALQIQLTKRMDEVSSAIWSNGHPRVVCNLNAAQADHVKAHGVPQSLKDAMLAAAPGNWMGWSGPGPIPPDIVINPVPHFPP